MEEYFQTPSPSVLSRRILYTPSAWAKSNLIFLQETGSLQAIRPHVSTRHNLQSYLCFVVLEGKGCLEYDGCRYEMTKGDCAFIDCRKRYSHSTGENSKVEVKDADGIEAAGNACDLENSLWSLGWAHFYGANMQAIYDKYLERGGQPVFRPENMVVYTELLGKLYELAASDDYIRDMRINSILSELLACIMEQSWHPENITISKKRLDLVNVKSYLDEHYTEKISLDGLAGAFFINKFYLSKIFKDAYGTTINAYILSRRITQAKKLLRFTDMSIDEIGSRVGMNDANYFSRSFKKLEGISPSEYKKLW